MPRRASIAIHLILVALITIPLRYYLGDDRQDERFAWRMFSSVRVEKCNTVFLLGPEKEPLKASRAFHPAWVGVAQRGRVQVIEAMAQHLCSLEPGREVRVRVLCEQRPRASAKDRALLLDSSREDSDEDIELVARGLFDFCTTGSL